MTDVRATQYGGYVVTTSIAVGVRATQFGGYVVTHSLAEEVRATQFGGYVVHRKLKPPCDTTDAQCWRIERTDGEVFAYTAHDEALTFRGETYEPCAGLSSSALQMSAEFGATSNMDLTGIISDAIPLADLWAGKFDGARVEVWRVDWSDPDRAQLLAGGNCGSLKAGTSEYTFEVTTPADRLQQRPILQAVTPTCRFKTYDGRCGLDVATFTETGTVDGVASTDVWSGAVRRVFTDSTRAEADRYFQLGRLTWLTGANAGFGSDVKSFAAGRFVLEQQMQHAIEIGDTYSVTAGDDRSFATCVDKFANGVNFGGFPHVRGTDDLQKTPKVKT